MRHQTTTALNAVKWTPGSALWSMLDLSGAVPQRPGVTRQADISHKMKSKIALSTAVAGCCLLTALPLVSCSRSPGGEAGASRPSYTTHSLSASEAAQLAADLANDQCERRYHKRPFRPEQHAAVLQRGKFQWGGLDVGGPGGYSALVTFAYEGSHPKVEVYFSTDVF